jgi:thiamine-monophosphate kinase
MPTSRSSRLRTHRVGARRRITEFELIRRLRQLIPIPSSRTASIIAGIGDDAAIVQPTVGHVLVATTDLVAEHVHFDLTYMTYRQVGYRAVIANLSDIAAMGGSPRYALVALAVGPNTTARDVTALYTGIAAACTAAETAVIGGDTSASTNGLIISIALLGEAKPGQILRRGGARPGDVLYVTGTLGDSRAGLELLRARRHERTILSPRATRFLMRRHIAPTARLSEGQALSESQLATAAIDVSDGLAGDLRHICEENSVGALIDLRRLPLSPALRAFARARHHKPFDYALSGGEDYELLFTVSKANVARTDALIRRGRLCATPIGVITDQKQGIRMMTTQGKITPLTARSYEHHIGGRRERARL